MAWLPWRAAARAMLPPGLTLPQTPLVAADALDIFVTAELAPTWVEEVRVEEDFAGVTTATPLGLAAACLLLAATGVDC